MIEFNYKWHVECANDCDGEPTKDYYVCHEETECDATTICKIENYDAEQNEAIAQLIAAVPELLEALELIVGAAERSGVRKSVTDLARKAIAKSRMSPPVRQK